MVRHVCLSTLALLIAAALGFAQQAAPKRVERTISIFEVTKVEDAKGKKVEDRMSKTWITYEFDETVLAADEKTGKPVQLERKYLKADIDNRRQPLQDQTVMITRQKNGSWKFEINGRELKRDDVPHLYEEFNEPDWRKLSTPEKKPKPGDEWGLNAKEAAPAISSRWGLTLDPEYAGVRVWDDGVRQFEVAYPVERMLYKDARIDAKDSSLVVEGRFDVQTTGRFHMESTVTARMALTGTYPDGKDGPLTVTILRVARTREKQR